MKLIQETRLEQKLSPQLIQSLKLLQLSTLELEQFMKQELDTNPLLDEREMAEVSQEQALQETRTETGEQFDEQDWRRIIAEDGDAGGRGFRADTSREFVDLPQPADVGLQEHLLGQLNYADISEDDSDIAEEIIGSINEDGYLKSTIEEIMGSSSGSQEDVERVLKVIQSFDPSGVGARDLEECLSIQLQEKGLENTILMALVEEHLDDLQHHRYTVIAKALDIYESEVQSAVEELSRLNPKPASGRFGTAARTIIPDMIVDKIDDKFVVLYNDSSIPRLRISSIYKDILAKTSEASDETKQYIVEKLNGARWLLRAIQQRRSTMLKVMEYIVKAQHEFLEHGVLHLKPMILQEVADAIEMHVSTISRVTNGKYVQTPQGIFELKFFFGGRIENRGGKDASNKAIKKQIERLIQDEDGSKPMSDQKIVEVLREKGYEIARRTVAKYRDQMNIQPARFRKQY
ncbi:RNA polymerase factor sigma-54 [Gemmatimonadota bacterium]